ncbi:MAG TPA: hypothetical protein VGN16_04580 [Acidobacteriaceae bacterium]
MNPFIQQLLDLLNSLAPAPGTPPEALQNLLRTQAAALILQTPANAVIPPGLADPVIRDAIVAGAKQAAALTAAGKHLRLLPEQVPVGSAASSTPEHRSERFGPFASKTGQLARFVSIESAAFVPVTQTLPPGSPDHTLLLMLIPQATTSSADRRTWRLPAGTVWIQARLFVANTQNLVGVRVNGGTLTFDHDPIHQPGIFLSPGTLWKLSLDLEQPPAAAADASDAEALGIQLPRQLLVSNSAPPSFTGGLTLSGFGSDLNFSAAGAPILDGSLIAFPLSAAQPSWSISKNLSRVAQFSGEVAVIKPRWTLPICSTPITDIGEASHAGSLTFAIGDGLTSTLAAQGGDPFRWLAATLTCNAEQIELQSLQPVSGASYDLALWQTSLTRVRFAGQSLSLLNFRSERGGMDEVAVSGGSCVNQWDLPRRADGKPFEFDAAINVFGLYTSSSSIALTLLATAPTPQGFNDFAGFVLENLYLLVRPPRRIAVNAGFDTAPAFSSGAAVVFFDVGLAVPTLPDPYATNIFTSRRDTAVSRALRVTMPWMDSGSPSLSAQLDSAVPFPSQSVALSADADESILRKAFQDHIQSHDESLLLLDLSSREHLFGVAIEAVGNNQPQILDNLLSVQLNRVRLLMQPQVQWEPVQIEPAVAGQPAFGHSISNGGSTLLGANSVKLVPTLPTSLSDEILEAIAANSPAAALFSLPFGLRAMAQLDLVAPPHPPRPVFLPATDTSLNEPAFADLTSARQVRLLARPHNPSQDDPSRIMPGMMRLLANMPGMIPATPVVPATNSVLPENLRANLNTFASIGIPLHRADLSGYGLSSFSQWHQDVEGAGFSKVEFQVLNGRTAYEVIQFRSILYESGARVVRTIILERHNSGRVLRIDTGWVAVDDAEFKRPDAFQKGAVRSFKNIRRIRIAGADITLDPVTSVTPVLFDADADIEGAIGGIVPIYDRPGYIQITPVAAVQTDATSKAILKLLFDKVRAIGSPINCAVRVGATLEAQISSIVSDTALNDVRDVGFAVAIVGAPKLPRAGQWSFVRFDPITDSLTGKPTPVDAHRGVPIVRNGADAFKFREPSDARRTTPAIEYSLLMATETSRAMFKAARIDPNRPGKLLFDSPPVFADPHSLTQSSGAFPRPNFALPLVEIPSFTISDDDLWRIDNSVFTLANKPLASFMQGGGWGLARDYDLTPSDLQPNVEKIILGIDSAAAAPFDVAVPPSLLNLQLPDPLGPVIQIKSQYKAIAGELSRLADPTLLFAGALKRLTEVLDSLSNLTHLPFHFDVSITAGSGASPSFVVHMGLLFRIGDGPDGRVEIGLGKFYGQFTVKGELQAALTGIENALLFIEFQGDIQQGIFPPLLYAGGLFRFSVELRETGGPLIQLTLGIVISIGGDLIPGLLAVEGTIKYGYSLVPETLQPGALVGIEARAKLLLGLIGFSFSAEVLARVRRNNPATVTIFATIHIAASVHVAIFFDEDVDFETQFQQDIPLAALALVPGVGLGVFAAEVPV